jgi:hypothetical protein
MEKRYQVFVSSTYTDLVDERRAVMQSLLELSCFPAGMELFPAADSAAWRLIEGVISDSDFYVVVVGGRYGSIGKDSDLSFTEREYEFAVSKGLPVLPFLHASPGGDYCRPGGSVRSGSREAGSISEKAARQTSHQRVVEPGSACLAGYLGDGACNQDRAEGWMD